MLSKLMLVISTLRLQIILPYRILSFVQMIYAGVRAYIHVFAGLSLYFISVIVVIALVSNRNFASCFPLQLLCQR